MKTILFGGSFDPIHNGHLEIVNLAKNIIGADRIIIIPAKTPRWKENLASKEDRFNMINLAIKDYPYMEVSRIELDSDDEVNYSYNTVCRIKKVCDDELYFLIGADHVEKLDKWYEIDKLSSLVHFIAFSRKDFKMDEENIKKYNIQVLGDVISLMSSSSLRECNNLDAPIEVLNYIESHELYYIKTIKEYISEKRFSHSLSVANLAYEIAKENGVEPHKAYLAGLLHDIGKEVDIDTQIRIIKEIFDGSFISVQKPLYHQFTSIYIAKTKFKIDDEEILEAIINHATGNKNMSKLAKIIYASDKIEPTRGYDSSEMIALCKKNIDEGFIKVLEENVIYFKKKNIDYHNPLTDLCIEEYLEGRK